MAEIGDSSATRARELFLGCAIFLQRRFDILCELAQCGFLRHGDAHFVLVTRVTQIANQVHQLGLTAMFSNFDCRQQRMIDQSQQNICVTEFLLSPSSLRLDIDGLYERFRIGVDIYISWDCQNPFGGRHPLRTFGSSAKSKPRKLPK